MITDGTTFMLFSNMKGYIMFNNVWKMWHTVLVTRLLITWQVLGARYESQSSSSNHTGAVKKWKWQFFPPDPYPGIGSDPIFRWLLQVLYVQEMTESGWILLFGQILVEENENHPSGHKYVRSTMRPIPVWIQILPFLPKFWRGWLSELQCLNGLISL